MVTGSAPLEQDGEPVDGRARRATRTRQLVVESFLDLLEAGEPHPTALQVSQRSGVSMRSIFRLFDDVEALHAAAVATQIDRVAPLLVPLDGTGPLRRRVKALVDSRATLFEAISPVRRMAVRLAPSSRPIRADLALANEFLRTQITEVFDRELMAMRAASRRDAVELLDACTSWESWERLRSVQGIADRQSRRLVASMVRGILAG